MSKIDIAKDFLKKFLSAGPVLASEATKEAKDNKIEYQTLNRARKDLGFETIRSSFGTLEWWWYDPDMKLDDDQRETWFKKHSDWAEDYDKSAPLKDIKASYEELIGQLTDTDYYTLKQDSTYYFDNSESRRGKQISTHYDLMIDKYQKTGDLEAIKRLQTQKKKYEKNLDVPLYSDPSPKNAGKDLNQAEQWLLIALKDGPKKKLSLVEEAGWNSISEDELVSAFTSLELDSIEGLEKSEWWTDIDRYLRNKQPRHKGIKSALRDERREKALHRKEFEKYYGYNFDGQIDNEVTVGNSSHAPTAQMNWS